MLLAMDFFHQRGSFLPFTIGHRSAQEIFNGSKYRGL